MKRERMRRMTLAAVIFAAVAALAAQAGAEIIIAAEVSAPGIRVHAGNVPSCNNYTYLARRMPARGYIHHEITLRDRRIARRLAWYTGVPAPRILRLRSFGYTWNEIGRALYVPRNVVRAAKSQKKWNRFLAMERRRARRYGYRHRTTRFEEREYRRR